VQEKKRVGSRRNNLAINRLLIFPTLITKAQPKTRSAALAIFFGTFILVSRDYYSNNALKDNLCLIFRYVAFDMLRFWKYALYAFLRFALFKEKSARMHGYKVVT
jgi:hypothetical protein